ncbi:hypothetical protein ACJW30_06G006600 [Castanea mollissima]
MNNYLLHLLHYGLKQRENGGSCWIGTIMLLRMPLNPSVSWLMAMNSHCRNHMKSQLAMRSQWTDQIHTKSHLAISNEISYSMYGVDLHDFSFDVTKSRQLVK